MKAFGGGRAAILDSIFWITWSTISSHRTLSHAAGINRKHHHAAGTAAPRALKSATGPAPKAPGARNALHWQALPVMTRAGGRVPHNTSFHPASARRLRIICPSSSWLGKGTDWPTNWWADIQNKTKQKAQTILCCSPRPPADPPARLWLRALPRMCPQPLGQASQPLKAWTQERG